MLKNNKIKIAVVEDLVYRISQANQVTLCTFAPVVFLKITFSDAKNVHTFAFMLN